MVDTQGYQQIMASANRTKIAVEKEQWKLATQLWGITEGVIVNMTGNIDFYNILYKSKSGSNVKDINNNIEGKHSETFPFEVNVNCFRVCLYF